MCSLISENRRSQILNDFFDLGSLEHQRHWITRHITPVILEKPAGRKSRTYKYFLPKEDGTQAHVCKVMLLNSLGISERQVRTSMGKLNHSGIVEVDKRGGRHDIQKVRDEKLHDLVRTHIDRFPKMESHYCRQKTTSQYLSSDLTLTKMHELYNREHEGDEKVSLSLYNKVFKSMGLKFHHPKKDQCGLCETYRTGNDEERKGLHERYEKHIREKEKVREIKENLKANATTQKKFLAACFDLQQVLFLPYHLAVNFFTNVSSRAIILLFTILRQKLDIATFGMKGRRVEVLMKLHLAYTIS